MNHSRCAGSRNPCPQVYHSVRNMTLVWVWLGNIRLWPLLCRRSHWQGFQSMFVTLKWNGTKWTTWNKHSFFRHLLSAGWWLSLWMRPRDVSAAVLAMSSIPLTVGHAGGVPSHLLSLHHTSCPLITFLRQHRPQCAIPDPWLPPALS